MRDNDIYFFLLRVIKSCYTAAQLRRAKRWAVSVFDKNYNARKPRRFFGLVFDYEYEMNERNRCKFRDDLMNEAHIVEGTLRRFPLPSHPPALRIAPQKCDSAAL